jgi:hypothetical protein
MPAPLPFSVRQRLFALWQQGHPGPVIAQRLRLALRTVRRFCHASAHQGEAALRPAYVPSAPPQPDSMIQQALLLHQQHPSWGAPFLRVRLRQLHPSASLPPG